MKNNKRKKEPYLYDGPEVERCRQVRQEIWKQFKTIEELCAHIRELEKESPRNIAMGKRFLASRNGHHAAKKTRRGAHAVHSR